MAGKNRMMIASIGATAAMPRHGHATLDLSLRIGADSQPQAVRVEL